MNFIVLFVAIGFTLNIRWLRRDLKRLETEVIELHKELLHIRDQAR